MWSQKPRIRKKVYSYSAMGKGLGSCREKGGLMFMSFVVVINNLFCLWPVMSHSFCQNNKAVFRNRPGFVWLHMFDRARLYIYLIFTGPFSKIARIREVATNLARNHPNMRIINICLVVHYSSFNYQITWRSLAYSWMSVTG